MTAMNQIPVPSPFRQFSDVIAGLGILEKMLIVSGDRRGVFVTAYLEITRTIQEWLRRRYFIDNEMVARYVVAFANLYRRAFANYECEARDKVPDSWVLSFDASRNGKCTITQDLLLGINAHINHDLPFAVLQANLNLSCESCYRDHTRINDALHLATRNIRHKIVSIYQPSLRIQNLFLGRSIDKLIAVAFQEARQNAWTAAQALGSADSPVEKQKIGQIVHDRAALAGQLILNSNSNLTRCIKILQEAASL